MSHSPQHEKQRSKNYTLLAILLALVAALFGLTIFKMSGVM